MHVFRQIPRTLCNAVIVRGKWRIPRMLLSLFLSVLIFIIAKNSLCLLSPSFCQTEIVNVDSDTGHIYLRNKGSFELVDKHQLPGLPISLSKTTDLLDPPKQVNNPNLDIPQANAHDDSYPESNDELEDARYDQGGVKVDDEEAAENQEYIDIDQVVDDSEEIVIPDGNAHTENNNENALPLVDWGEQEMINVPPPNSDQVDAEEDAQPLKKSPKEAEVPQRTVKVADVDEGNNAKNEVDNGAAPKNESGQVTAAASTEHAQNKTASNSTAVPDEFEEFEEETEEIGEEGEIMSPEEVAEALRTGEMCKSICPPFRWSKWSPCSKACGRGRRYRKALYEFVCPSTVHCPGSRIEESVCESPCRFDPDKYGGPNGLDLYPVNPLNPIIYMDKYGCGNWLVEYEKIHKDILTGKRPPSFLVYSTGKGDYPTAGGISGRLKGITTVFFMAVLLERAFVIEWEDPPGLEDYLKPKSFNWADLAPIRGRKHGPIRDIASWKAAKDDGHSSQWYMNTNFTRYFKYPVERIQGARYDFTYALLRNPELMPKAFEYGIDRIKCRLCCAWDMLFKMAPNFEAEMNTLLKSISYPNKPLLAVQVRAKSTDIEQAVKVAEHNVNCGQKASRDLKINPVYIPIFNNRLVVHIVAKKYKRLMKTPIEIETATRTVHTHFGNLPSDTELEVAKGVQERTFKEFFIMLNSTVLIRTKGYLGSMGNVADAIRRHYAVHGKKVYTYTAGGTTCSVIEDDFKIE